MEVEEWPGSASCAWTTLAQYRLNISSDIIYQLITDTEPQQGAGRP